MITTWQCHLFELNKNHSFLAIYIKSHIALVSESIRFAWICGISPSETSCSNDPFFKATIIASRFRSLVMSSRTSLIDRSQKRWTRYPLILGFLVVIRTRILFSPSFRMILIRQACQAWISNSWCHRARTCFTAVYKSIAWYNNFSRYGKTKVLLI